MNISNIPVYTSFALCRDCYKCVRECTVKAIKIENGQASIIKELCIHCGHCVDVCPVSAKKIRNDIPRLLQMLDQKDKIAVSLAPSWVCEFPELNEEKIIESFMKMGFQYVSETAVGADILNGILKNYLSNSNSKIHLSTACPSVVEMVQLHYPQVSQYLTPFLSPLLIHSNYIKDRLGQDVKIVFFGPCISKKKESDFSPDLLNCALTFNDLRELWEYFKIRPSLLNGGHHYQFYPDQAGKGAYYPIDGGMLKGLIDKDNQDDFYYYSFSGLKNIQNILLSLDDIKTDKPVFLELLACEGGCINGPGTNKKNSGIRKQINVSLSAENRKEISPDFTSVNNCQNYETVRVPERYIDESEIKNVFYRIGKYHKSDELNCGACGYDTCRDCAIAIINEKAEPDMCVSYLRKLAQNKINALFKTMPSAVVIVNKDLQVVECNDNFLDMFDLKEKLAIHNPQDFQGAELSRIVQFYDLFEQVLLNNEDLINQNYAMEDKVLNLSIFTIEEHRLAGAVLQDVTHSSLTQERIITNAKKVIHKNLDMASKIAYLLGENVAEIETALSNIIETFDQKKIHQVKTAHSVKEEKNGY